MSNPQSLGWWPFGFHGRSYTTKIHLLHNSGGARRDRVGSLKDSLPYGRWQPPGHGLTFFLVGWIQISSSKDSSDPELESTVSHDSLLMAPDNAFPYPITFLDT